MSSFSRGVWLCLIAGVLAISISPVTAEDEASSANVFVTIVKGRMQGESKVPEKTYQVVAVDGGERVELMSGSRIPIPVTNFQASTPPNREIVPMTSYTYQNVGFTARVRVWIGPDRKITLNADIEDSRIDPDDRSAQPKIETNHQQIKAVLTDGEPLQITRMADEADGAVYFEIEARLAG